MINKDIEKEIMEKQNEWPLYQDYCLSNIPQLINKVLNKSEQSKIPAKEVLNDKKEYENVITILIDGFGYKFWKRHRNQKLIDEITKKGKVTPITSIYPSETAAALTSFYTGTTPNQHGIIGWFDYIPEIEQTVMPLPFLTRRRETIKNQENEEYQVKQLINNKTTKYRELKENNVQSYAYFPNQITNSKYTEYINKEAETKGYDDTTEMIKQINKQITKNKEENKKTYHYGYIPSLDKLSHFEGTETISYKKEIKQITKAIRKLTNISEKQKEKTLLVITADHGFTNTDPLENIELEKHPEIIENLKEKENGEKILPVGGPRNTHLHVKKEKIKETKKTLEKNIPHVQILEKEQAIQKNLFGKQENTSKQFRERCGNLIINHPKHAIWTNQEQHELDMRGHHGGITSQEMLIPLATIKLNKIRKNSLLDRIKNKIATLTKKD